MRKPLLIGICCLVVFAGIFVAEASGAFSIREWLGFDDKSAQAAEEAGTQQSVMADPGTQDWASPSGSAGLELQDIQNVVTNLDANRRRALLGDEQTFRQFVQQEADNESVLAAARANNLQDNDNVAFLMRRGAENVLREAFVNRVIANKIPAGFPSEEQIKEYFEANKDKFVVEERLHVWQIFLPLADGADAGAVSQAENRAAGIVRDLGQGKVEFESAASAHSTHEPSRFNGGYMGLVKVSDLKPEIRGPLLDLKEGQISKPIRTDAGVHILKRGASVEAQNVTYEDVRDQIRKLLLNQARSQLRAAIFQQARESYPVGLKEAKIEEWRLRLRTNLESSQAAAAE